MPFPNKSFGNEVDPREAAMKSVNARGDRYKWLRQTRCNKECPYYFKGCIYISLSKTPQYGGKCAVKNLPDKQQERVIRFLEGKQEDYMANMVELYQEIENSVKLRKDPAMLMQAFDRLQRMYQMFHGDKREEDAGVDMRELFDKMGDHLKELEDKMKRKDDDAKTNRKGSKVKTGSKKPVQEKSEPKDK